MPAAAQPIARFCGEIIFASTPPELLDAAISVGLKCAFFAAVTWSTPNSELDEVSDPVTAVPSQPSSGDRKAKKPPAPAAQVPSVMVSPERFITYARARTAITVTIADLSCTSVAPYARSARRGLILSTSMLSTPESSSNEPAALAQLNL